MQTTTKEKLTFICRNCNNEVTAEAEKSFTDQNGVQVYNGVVCPSCKDVQTVTGLEKHKSMEDLKAELLAEGYEPDGEALIAMPERVKYPYRIKTTPEASFLVDISYPSKGKHLSIIEKYVLQ